MLGEEYMNIIGAYGLQGGLDYTTNKCFLEDMDRLIQAISSGEKYLLDNFWVDMSGTIA